MQPDAELLTEFGALAKEANLPQEAAQKIVELAGKMVTGNATKAATAFNAQVTEFYSDIGGTPETWVAAAKADKEFGGEKFNENLALAKSALDQFGTPELSKYLMKTKAGNHPELLRAFVRIGKAISQDGFVPGRASGARKSDADVIYATH